MSAIKNFITDALNIDDNDIESLSIVKQDDTYIFRIQLKNTHPACPYCGGVTVIKGYSTHVYTHLKIFSFPSSIEWRRIRYKCKDCSKTFSQDNPFGPEHFHVSYAVLRQIVIDLRNPNFTFKDIAEKHGISLLR